MLTLAFGLCEDQRGSNRITELYMSFKFTGKRLLKFNYSFNYIIIENSNNGQEPV